MALLDNYEASTGRDEEVTQEEVRENRAFIDAIMETKVRLCTIHREIFASSNICQLH